jgi:uncharacterized membrane protein
VCNVHYIITTTYVWALIAAACGLTTVASATARLLVPARATRLPAPAALGAVTITAALIWLTFTRRFPDDPSLAETVLYAATFIAATAATIMLAVLDEASTSIRPLTRRHNIGLILLGAATIGLLLALTDAFIT